MDEAAAAPQISRAAISRVLAILAPSLAAGTLEDVPVWGRETRELAIFYDWMHSIRRGIAESSLDMLGTVLDDAISALGAAVIPKYPTMTYQAAARRLFPSPTKRSNQPAAKTRVIALPPRHGDRAYVYSLRLLCAELGIREGKKWDWTRRNLTEDIRDHLAEMILILAYPEIPSDQLGGEAGIDQPNGSDRTLQVPTIPRLQLEQEVLDRLGNEVPLVVLWGESGNGKSVLARSTVNKHFKNSRTAILRGPAGRRSPFWDADVIAALQTAGLQPETWTRAAREQALCRLIASGTGLDLIVLDNVDADTAIRFTSTVKLPVIVTTLVRPQGRAAHSVRVRAFEDEEATELVRQMIPDANIRQVEALCHALGNRPLAISIFSRLVRDGHSSIENLLRIVNDDLPTGFEWAVTVLDEPPAPPLILVYTTLLEALGANSVEMAVLLTVLWICEERSSANVLGLARGEQIFDAGSIAFRSALLKLEQRAVFELDGEIVRMNDLTREMLRTLTAQSADLVLREFCSRFDMFVPVTAFDASSEDSLEQMYASAVQTYRPYMEDGYEFIHLHVAMSSYIARLTMKAFSPNKEIGMISVGGSAWVCWQAPHVRWFSPPTDNYEVALITGDVRTMKVWHSGTSRPLSNRDFFDAQMFIAMREVTDANLATVLNICLGSQEYWEPGRLELWPNKRADLVHSPLSFLSRNVLQMSSAPVWSACGVLYTPAPATNKEVEPAPCPNCSQADAASSDHQLFLVRCMASLLKFGDNKAALALQKRVFNTLLFLHRSSGDDPRSLQSSVYFEEQIESAPQAHWDYSLARMIGLHQSMLRAGHYRRACVLELKTWAFCAALDSTMPSAVPDEVFKQLARDWELAREPHLHVSEVNKVLATLTGADGNEPLPSIAQDYALRLNSFEG